MIPNLMGLCNRWLAGFVELVKLGFPAQLARVIMDRDFDHFSRVELGHQWSTTAAQMDWPGWAVPAILTELHAHRHRRDRYCRCRLYCETHGEWAEHVAPLIAARIGCDPRRAAQALSRYKPDKV